MQKIKRSIPLVAIIGILFATGIVFSQAFIAQKNQTKLGTPVALGDEEDDGEVENEDEDDDDNDDDDNDKDEVDEEENDDEDKDDDEDERRTTVRTSTTSRVQTTATVRKQEEDDEDENEKDDEDEDENEDQEDLAELKGDVSKVEAKIAKLSQAGISAEPFSAPLVEIKGLIAQIESKIAAKADAEALLETADNKLERLEKLVKIALGGEEDDDEEEGKESDDDKDEEIAKTYKNSVAQFVQNLKEIGDIEGGIGQQVKVVAQAQNDTQAKVEESISEVEKRNGFLKFLVGPDYSGIANVQTAITENQTRIKVLSDLLSQVTDPAVKLVLQGQVTSLQQQNEKLQSFVSTSSEGVSLFGWLVKLFQ